MNTVELFAGTQSFSKVARELGHETFCVDSNVDFLNDLTWYVNFNEISEDEKLVMDMIKDADIVWMSPPCTTFSMAAGNTHWNADRSPKTDKAVEGEALLRMCKYIAQYCIDNNKIFFIENPRARARWFLPVEWRKTAWYCQYGDSRAKPTDIWTNLPGWEPKTCHNFLKNQPKHCHHEAAPRGSKTGTQGLKNDMLRSVIPPKLFHEIFSHISSQNVQITSKNDKSFINESDKIDKELLNGN